MRTSTSFRLERAKFRLDTLSFLQDEILLDLDFEESAQQGVKYLLPISTIRHTADVPYSA